MKWNAAISGSFDTSNCVKQGGVLSPLIFNVYLYELILLLTLSDPGYFRQLTIRGWALKAPPPYDLENCCVNLHHIIHMDFTRCFWHDPIGIFQKFAILTVLQRFQNKK